MCIETTTPKSWATVLTFLLSATRRVAFPRSLLAATVFAVLAPAGTARAADLIEVQPLTDRILLLYFNDGYVEHHKRGEPRSHETVITEPLYVAAAARAAKSPLRVGRKSKATDFA